MEYNNDLGALITASSDGTVKITEVVNRAQTKMVLKGHQVTLCSVLCAHFDCAYSHRAHCGIILTLTAFILIVLTIFLLSRC